MINLSKLFAESFIIDHAELVRFRNAARLAISLLSCDGASVHSESDMLSESSDSSGCAAF